MDACSITAASAQAEILRRAALDSARLLEAAGEFVGAARAYGRVIDSGEVVLVDAWHGLAVNLARAGDALAAERAFLRGLDASGRASDQIRFRYDLAGFYAREGRRIEALAVVEALAPHAPESPALLDAARLGARRPEPARHCPRLAPRRGAAADHPGVRSREHLTAGGAEGHVGRRAEGRQQAVVLPEA